MASSTPIRIVTREARYIFVLSLTLEHSMPISSPTAPGLIALAAICPKHPKAQVNALSLNTLDVELSEHILAQLDLEDDLSQDFCQLSLNALSGTD